MRKNPIFKTLREKLHNFRADDVQVDISAETAGTYDNHQLTGREIVTIKLTGKFKGVKVSYKDGDSIVTQTFDNPSVLMKYCRDRIRANKKEIERTLEETQKQTALLLNVNKGGEINAGQTDSN